MASRSNPYGAPGGKRFSLELMPGDPPASATRSVAPPAPRSGDITLSLAGAEVTCIDSAANDRNIAVPAPAAAPPSVQSDPYVQQAAREYAQGLVDQALWDRALLQANGDKAAAAGSYLRSRGIALRVHNKHLAAPVATTLEPDEAAIEERRRFVRRVAWKRYGYGALGAAAMALAATVFMLYLRGDVDIEPVAAPAPAAAASSAVVDTPASGGSRAAPATRRSAPANADSEASRALAMLQAKIQELRDSGNWNVLVLHAAEWTRLEPDNPAAWSQMRAGYMYLGQYEDAVAAARKAVEVAPDQAMLWRRLGEANAALDDPAAALAAFRGAVARNSEDVASLQAIGLFATRLGDAKEGRAAFDRALAVRPGNALTTCLRNGAAQLPTTRDAYIASRQVSELESKCRGSPVPPAP